jgi:hypothetical protein
VGTTTTTYVDKALVTAGANSAPGMVVNEVVVVVYLIEPVVR